jgi:hypothetical protein
MDLFTYRDKISQPLTACKRNPGVCAYTQTVICHFSDSANRKLLQKINRQNKIF